MNERKEQETKRLQRQKQLQDEDTKKQAESQEQQAEDVAAFLAGEGGVATGVIVMDTTPPLNPPSSSADVSSSSVSDAASQPPDQQIGQDSQTTFQEPLEPPPQEQQQWPQTAQDQPESLHLTATNPELAQVLPPGAVAMGTATNSAESANFSSSTSMVAPSALPPTYDQVAAGQGAYDGANVPIGGYDPAYQQAQPPPPAAAGSYFPPPAAYASPPQGGGPYDYQYAGGAPLPPAPVVGGVPSYGQQFSAPGPGGSTPSPHSFASTANWASFDSGSGSSGLPSQQPQEPSVPYVDRSTKPTSLTGLSTGWGGKTITRYKWRPSHSC